MHRIAVTVVALLLVPSWWSAAAPAMHWQEVQSTAAGFAVLFPGKPKLVLTPVANAHGAVEHSWRLDISDHETYELAVTIYPGATFPPPTIAFYDRLLDGYAANSQTHLRTRRMIAVDGHPAVEAFFDGDHDFHHLIDILVVGDRLYIVASGGSGAYERNADALKFHRSFRLLGS
jgi:hypothetical protein